MNFPELMSTVESSTSYELIHLLIGLGLIKSSVTCLICGELGLGLWLGLEHVTCALQVHVQGLH